MTPPPLSTRAEHRFEPYRPDDAEAFLYLIRQAFGASADRAQRYRALFGESCFRVLRRGGTVVAGAAAWTMPQWFGGRPLPSRGVAAVAVDPAARGTGAGTTLMKGVMEEAVAEGCALSVLYPATLPFYTRLGYGRAGAHVRYRAAPGQLFSGREAPEIERMTTLDADLLAELRRREARFSNGLLERNEALWTFTLRPGDGAADVYLFPGATGPEGYLVVQPPIDGRLRIADHCLLTRRAARHALAFVAGYRSQARTIAWEGGPEDPFIHLAAETDWTVDKWDEWVLRILDVPAALAGRGYPEFLRAALTLDVTDPILPANHGRFRLTVDGGCGTVERLPTDGPSDLALGVSALATLFSGQLTPAALGHCGLLEAEAPALSLAGLMFAGPRPRLAEHF